MKLDLLTLCKKFEEKYGLKCPNTDCIHCIKAAVDGGYISDTEIRAVVKHWHNKKKTKQYKSMLLDQKIL